MGRSNNKECHRPEVLSSFPNSSTLSGPNSARKHPVLESPRFNIAVNKNGNCVIREVHRFYQGVLYSRYVIRFHDGGENLKVM
jgi:hypothetical protein